MGFETWKSLVSGGKKNVRSVRQGPALKRAAGKTSKTKSVAKSRGRKREAEDAPRIAAGSRKLEERWRAESDMRTLAETAKILETPSRVTAAKKVAMEQAAAAQEAASAVLNVKTTKGE